MAPKTKAGAALFIFVVAEALSLGLAYKLNSDWVTRRHHLN